MTDGLTSGIEWEENDAGGVVTEANTSIYLDHPRENPSVPETTLYL
jgi:hypothetical protein